MAIAEFSFDLQPSWGTLPDTLGGPLSFINGSGLGVDAADMQPVFNQGLTSYDSSQYMTMQVQELAPFSLVILVYVRSVNFQLPLITANDFSIVNMLSFSGTFVSLQVGGVSLSVSSLTESWNLIIFSKHKLTPTTATYTLANQLIP